MGMARSFLLPFSFSKEIYRRERRERKGKIVGFYSLCPLCGTQFPSLGRLSPGRPTQSQFYPPFFYFFTLGGSFLFDK
jgi:hypothetical protein